MADASKVKSTAGTQGKAPGAQDGSPVTRAVESIDAMIATGRLVPGQRLVEGDLSEELGIPVGRVREALRILAGAGVVELARFKSARVKRLSREEVASLFEAITGVFCIGAVLLATRYETLSAAEKQDFDDASEQLARAAGDLELTSLLGRMIAYHGLVNRLSGNPHLEKLMSGLHLAHFYKGVEEVIPALLLRKGLGQASAIGKAIKAGRPDQTVALLWEAIGPMLTALGDEQEPAAKGARGASRRRAAS